MRTLQLHFPNDALSALDTVLKQTKEARVFRRAQAVREVVKGTRLQTVSDTLAFTYSALSKWVHRFANEGIQGPVDRRRHGSLYSRWSCRELAAVLAQQTGIQLGRESVRCVLKKTR